MRSSPSLSLILVLSSCWGMLRASADSVGTVLGQSPLMFYRLNETLQPEAVRAVNAGILGAAADGEYKGDVVHQVAPGVRTGVPDGAVQVRGGGAVVPALASLNPEGAFSVEVWVRPLEALSGGAVACAMGSFHETGAGSWGWELRQTAGGWSFRVGSGGGTDGEVTGGGVEVGVWHHLVGVLSADGLGVLYVNGVEAGRRTGWVSAPNRVAPLGLGFRGDGALPFRGELDEAAVYALALSRERVEEHWVAGTASPSTSYETLVRSLGPLGYWRLGEPDRSLPAANASSLGTLLDGRYGVGATTGVPSLRAPELPGFEPGNTGIELDGGQGGVRLPALAPWTGPGLNRLTLTAWVKPASVPADFAGLVTTRAAGGLATGLGFSVGGQLGYGWGDSPASTAFRSGLVPPVGAWSYVALVIDPEQAVIFLWDGTGLRSATNRVAHGPLNLDSELWVGGDPGDPDRRYRGAVDELALWARSLSAGEILTQPSSAVGNVAPRILAQTSGAVGPVVAGTTFQLGVDAGGTPPLEYAWQLGEALIPGATGPRLTRTDASPADSGSYTVTVRNAFGSVTSSPIPVSVLPLTAPGIVTEPEPTTRYVGGTARFYAWADGARPLRYQWLRDGLPIPGGTNYILVLADVRGDAEGGYSMQVSNSVGAVTSRVARLTVQVPGSYAAEVMADRPLGYWRLGESGGRGAADLAGGYDGTASGGVVPGQPGALAGDSDTAMRFDGVDGRIELPPALDLHLPRFTVEAWARVTGGAGRERTVLASREEGPSRGYRLFAGADGTWRFQMGTGSGGSWETVVGPAVEERVWTYLAASYDGFVARLWVNGREASRPVSGYTPNLGQPVFLGSDGPGSVSGGTRFPGDLDEVGVYDAVLTAERLRVHHALGLGAAVSVGLSVGRVEGGLVLRWTEGVLEQAGAPGGPWSVVEGSSPQVVNPDGAGRFFRVRR